MILKDIYGRELIKGDTLAVVWHPEAYKFSILKARIVNIRENYVDVETDTGDTASYKKNDENVVTRVLKLVNSDVADNSNTPKDAVGQPINIGDRVAFQLPIELGNTCKGFEDGGRIVKITTSFVFTTDESTTKQRKKGMNKTVRITR